MSDETAVTDYVATLTGPHRDVYARARALVPDATACLTASSPGVRGSTP